MKRWMLVYLLLIITGTVNAAPAMQAVEVDVPPWAAVGGGAALVAWVLVSLINRSPKNGNDALVKLADNQAEAIKLDRERFEAQKEDDKERNKNIADLMDMYRQDHERMHNNEAAYSRQVSDDTQAKRQLAESLNAMTIEEARHNTVIETRLNAIESAMTEVRTDIRIVKQSVGPNTAEKLTAVETAFARLSEEFRGLVAAIQDAKQTEVITEVTHEEITIDTVTAVLPAAADAASAGAIDAGADAGGHA
jgi:chromosome segregation ATPase